MNKIRNTLSYCICILYEIEHPTYGIVNICHIHYIVGRIINKPPINAWDSVKTVLKATIKEIKIGCQAHVIDSNYIYARAMEVYSIKQRCSIC